MTTPKNPWIDPEQRIMDLQTQADLHASDLKSAEADLVECQDELNDLIDLTSEMFPEDMPLRDRVAHLVALAL